MKRKICLRNFQKNLLLLRGLCYNCIIIEEKVKSGEFMNWKFGIKIGLLLVLIVIIIFLIIYGQPNQKFLTILTYHHLQNAGSFDPQEKGGVIITPERFQEQLEAFTENGYQTVSLQELEAYYQGEGDLPDKPLLITFDDGYESNYLLAYPILQKMDMQAVIFVIGANLRDETDPEKGLAIFMTWQEAQEMEASGLIDIQTHTYDLHHTVEIADESQPLMTTRIPVDGQEESLEAYHQRIKEDLVLAQNGLKEYLNHQAVALSFPYGSYNKDCMDIASDLGMGFLFSTQPGLNTLRYKPDIYYRITMRADYSGEEAVGICQRN